MRRKRPGEIHTLLGGIMLSTHPPRRSKIGMGRMGCNRANVWRKNYPAVSPSVDSAVLCIVLSQVKKPPFLDGEQLLASRASSPAAINGLVKWNPGLLGLPGASKNARSCGIKIAADEGPEAHADWRGRFGVASAGSQSTLYNGRWDLPNQASVLDR